CPALWGRPSDVRPECRGQSDPEGDAVCSPEGLAAVPARRVVGRGRRSSHHASHATSRCRVPMSGYAIVAISTHTTVLQILGEAIPEVALTALDLLGII